MPFTYATPPKNTWQSFMRLFDAMEKSLGITKACKVCGVEGANIRGIRDGRIGLTDTTARKILAGYKKFKAGEVK